MRTAALAVFCAALATSAAAQPAPPAPQHMNQAPRHRAAFGKYDALEYPILLKRRDLQSLLQRFADASYMKGFRYLGDGEDFFHGHFLFADPSQPQSLFAVLYHTQERAAYHPADDKYGYLDAQARNWVEWLDPGKPIVNANALERTTYPPGKYWEDFQAVSLPGYRSKHSIHSDMLDPEKLGSTMQPHSDYEWLFLRVACDAIPDPIPEDSNAMEIRLAGAERACLLLATAQMPSSGSGSLAPAGARPR